MGFATAWIGINPVAILALAAASFARWTIISHHISHKAYENIPGAPQRYCSKAYARAWRRLLHWMDWMCADAWHHEHDVLHHYNLGEARDPDVPQNRVDWMADFSVPLPFRFAFVLLTAMVWKPLYYAPNTLNALLNKAQKTEVEFGSWALWSPFKKRFWQVLWRCWLPYTGVRFVLLPGLFLPIGTDAATSVLINLLIAEVVINIWTYLVIVPNHVGSDIYVFDQHPKNRAEFYLHQVLGSVNYRCGGDLQAFMHGWLNYQIEHHLFPDMTLLQYQKAHPLVRDICARHGVPMVCEPLSKRVVKLVKILTGIERQPVWSGHLMANEQRPLVFNFV